MGCNFFDFMRAIVYRRAGIFLTVCLALLGCSSGGDHDDTQELLQIQNGNVFLAASLDLPSSPGPHPVLIMVAGSGRVTRQQFAGSAARYNSIGFATLRFDKRGVGQSTGSYIDVNTANSARAFDELADDLVAITDYLFKQPEIRSDKIGMIGPSQAGWIIPLAASRSEKIAFTVCVSGAASSVGVSDYFDSIAENYADPNDPLIEIALNNYNGTQGFDPQEYLKVLNKPALWVYGGQDRSNPTYHDMAILESIRQDKDLDFTIHLFENADHELKDVVTGAPVPASQACVDPWLMQQLQP